MSHLFVKWSIAIWIFWRPNISWAQNIWRVLIDFFCFYWLNWRRNVRSIKHTIFLYWITKTSSILKSKFALKVFDFIFIKTIGRNLTINIHNLRCLPNSSGEHFGTGALGINNYRNPTFFPLSGQIARFSDPPFAIFMFYFGYFHFLAPWLNFPNIHITILANVCHLNFGYISELII